MAVAVGEASSTVDREIIGAWRRGYAFAVRRDRGIDLRLPEELARVAYRSARRAWQFEILDPLVGISE